MMATSDDEVVRYDALADKLRKSVFDALASTVMAVTCHYGKFELEHLPPALFDDATAFVDNMAECRIISCSMFMRHFATSIEIINALRTVREASQSNNP